MHFRRSHIMGKRIAERTFCPVLLRRDNRPAHRHACPFRENKNKKEGNGFFVSDKEEIKALSVVILLFLKKSGVDLFEVCVVILPFLNMPFSFDKLVYFPVFLHRKIDNSTDSTLIGICIEHSLNISVAG